jgi:hypothetical protein
MLRYLVKTEIAGIEIRLIESQFSLVLIYGMERRAFELAERKAAWRAYKESVLHAIGAGGLS